MIKVVRMISSDSATAIRTCTATWAERLPGLAMTSPKFASDHRFEVISRLNFTSTKSYDVMTSKHISPFAVLMSQKKSSSVIFLQQNPH